MKHTLTLLATLLLAPLAALHAADAPKKSDKPNIVFIYADDWGWGDLSCHGNTWLKTPRLDKLASEGIDFQQFNVLSPVCSPSRAAALTGRFPGRFGINTVFGVGKPPEMPDWLDPKAPTTPRLLKAAGYRTGHFGKWHLGEGKPTMADYGIDESAVYHGPGPKVGPSGNDIPNRAVKFIEANKDRPFYVNVWLHESHLAHSPSDESMARWKHLDPRQQVYAAVITDGDNKVGMILDALERCGIAQNTLVVFSSDNGPAKSKENDKGVPGKYRSHYSIGETGGLRGQKTSLFEGGGRVLIGPAGLLKADIAASNGVIHVIDQVLLPKTRGDSNVPRIGPFPYRYGKLKSSRYAYCPAPEAEQQNSQKVGAAQSCNVCHVLPAASFPEMWRNLNLGFDPKKKDAELANPNLFRWVKSGRNAMFGKEYAVMDLGQKVPPAPAIVKVGQEFDIELYTFINQEGARWYPGARPRHSGEEEEGFNPYGPNKALPEITKESVVRVGEISKLPLSGKPGETYDVCYSDSKFGYPTVGAFFNPDEKFGTRTTCGKYLARYRAVKAGTSEIRWQLYRQREDGKKVDVDGLDYFAEYVLPVKVE